MKIDKVINNNIVVVNDKDGEEIIYMGRGIGFKKHPGDSFDVNDIEKKFTLSTSKQMDQLTHLLNEIPLEEIDVAISIMEFASKELNNKLNDTAIVALSDHIHTSIERSKNNIFVKNILLWDIKKFYPDEFKIGKESLELIKEKIGVELPEDEAGFIALHVVNSQMEQSAGDMYGLTKVMQEIINIIKYTCNTTFNEESVYYYRFITHMKFFAQRLLSKTMYESNDDETLLSVVKVQYVKAYQCVQKIKKFILVNYSYELSNEEQMYLTIHIERILTQTK